MNSTERRLTLTGAIRSYWDKRFLIIFLLGFASGFPWILIGSAMTAWLQESGLSRTAIGFFGSIFVVYAFNFTWAPLLDRVKLPGLKRLGQRRSWILCGLSILLLLTWAIAFTDPGVNLMWTSLVALTIAIASATQDIAIDAYRIEIINPDETEKIPAGAAMATSGWWTGFSLPGGLAFILADIPGWTWSATYLALSIFLIALIIIVFFIPEPSSEREIHQRQDEQDAKERFNYLGASQWQIWLWVTVVQPIREFFQRNGWTLAMSILLFVFLFKVGEAFLGRMAIVFYKEIGFTNTEIGAYTKWFGGGLTIIFSIVGSLLSMRMGLIRGLFISGVAMAATNLMFSYLAIVGPDTQVLVLAIVVDNMTAAIATVTFVTFISYLTSRVYTASQYALLASIGNAGRTMLASFSGLMVDAMDGAWDWFFVITAIMVVPSLLLLLGIGSKLSLTENEKDQSSINYK